MLASRVKILCYKVSLVNLFLFTGFSFTSFPAGLPQTSEEAAESSLEFLRQFFLLFPDYASHPLLLIGQSYGGHFAPPIGTAIHKQNEENQQPRINFQGMMLLAPWTNPYVQVASYADYLHQTGFNTEPVLITYPDNQTLSDWISEKKKSQPIYNFSTTNKEKHQLWKIETDEEIAWLTKQFEEIPELYIADGHHRSASAEMLLLIKPAP